MSKRDPNDGIDCENSASKLYDAKNALTSAQAAVESASRALGIAERERDALQREYESPEGAGRTATYLEELRQRLETARSVATARHDDVSAAVATSNEAGSEVARQQNAYDYYCA
jgi:hypothetical protein